MGNRPDNIRNEGAYFYTVVKNMDLKDNIKQSKIYKHEISIEEAVYDKNRIYPIWTSSCPKRIRRMDRIYRE